MNLMSKNVLKYAGLCAVLLLAGCAENGIGGLHDGDKDSEFRNLNDPAVIRYRAVEDAVTRTGGETLEGAFTVCAWYHDDVTVDPMKTYLPEQLFNTRDPRVPYGEDLPLVGKQMDETALNWQGETVAQMGGLWVTENEHFWPKGYFTVDFFGLYPADMPYIRLQPYAYTGEGIPGSPNFANDTIVNYTHKTIPYSAYPDSVVTDLLFSYLRTGKNAWLPDGTVTLDFRHALSQLSFKGAVSDKNKDWIVEVKGMTLHNVYAAGTLDLCCERWKDQYDVTDYRLVMSGSTESNPFEPAEPITITYEEENYTENEVNKVRTKAFDLTDVSAPRLMIGQTLQAWDTSDHRSKVATSDGCYLSIVCHIWRENQIGNPEELLNANGEFQTIYIPLNPTWEPGKHYTYTLYFGGGYDEDGWPNIVETEITVSVTDWVQGEESSGSAEFN